MALQPNNDIRRTRIHVMVVGRRATGEAVRAILAPLIGPVGALQTDGARPAPANDGELPTLLTFSVSALTSQKAALDEIRKHPPKLVLVELDRGPQSRQRFCAMVRYRLPASAIYAISATPPTGTFVFDGLLHVPLRGDEVLAAARTVQEESGDNIIQRGPLRLNLAARTVVGPNGQRHLTPKQCALLQYLMLHVGKVVGRAAIMSAIWETDYIGDTRTLDVHIRWLRECIEPDPSNPVYLVTARGKGYLLNV